MRNQDAVHRSSWRLLKLVVPTLLLLAAFLTAPTPRAQAYTICGSITIDYYSNDTYTVLVGHCTIECAGGETCDGTMTDYTKTISECHAC